MLLCKEADTCLCMPKAIFSKLPARPRVPLSLLTQSASLRMALTANQQKHTPFRSRTNSLCTSETLRVRAYNVRDLVLSCCATCLQIRQDVKLIFILHLIGSATRSIPKMFHESYFCMNNQDAKHQDMQIPSSPIGATAWSIFKLCELHLATKNVTTNVQSFTVKTDKMD